MKQGTTHTCNVTNGRHVIEVVQAKVSGSGTITKGN